MRPGAEVASRPALGRRPNTSVTPEVTNDTDDFPVPNPPIQDGGPTPAADVNNIKVEDENSAEESSQQIQTEAANTVRHNQRPARATRNANPIYR